MIRIVVLYLCVFIIAACDKSSQSQSSPVQATETQVAETPSLPTEQSQTSSSASSGQNPDNEGVFNPEGEALLNPENEAVFSSCGRPLPPFVIEGLNISAHDISAFSGLLFILREQPPTIAEEGVAWEDLRLFIYADIMQPVYQAKRWRFSLFNSAHACSPAPYSEADMVDVSVISDAALGAEYPAGEELAPILVVSGYSSMPMYPPAGIIYDTQKYRDNLSEFISSNESVDGAVALALRLKSSPPLTAYHTFTVTYTFTDNRVLTVTSDPILITAD